MASNGLSERLQTPISTAELQRRWAAVRAAMAREKIDVLLMQNNNDHMGGYVKYFTDMPATDRKSTRLNSSHMSESRMPSSA